MVIKSAYVLKNTFINFNQPYFQTGPTKNSKNEQKKISTFWAQNLLKLTFLP